MSKIISSESFTKGAWALEYGVVFCGFILAVSLNNHLIVKYTGSGYDFTALATLLGGVLPLVAIAFIELCKIKFVQMMVYTRNWIFRILFLCAVMIVSIITFETFYITLKRLNISSAEYINDLSSEINKIEGIVDIQTVSIDDNTDYEISSNPQKLSSQLNAKYDKKIKSNDQELVSINSVYDNSLTQEESPIKAQIASHTNKLKDINNSISSTKSDIIRYENALSDCGVLSKKCKKQAQAGIDKSDQRFQTLLSEKSTVESKLSSLHDKLENVSGVNLAEKNAKIEAIKNDRKAIEKWYAKELDKIAAITSAEVNTLTAKSKKADLSAQEKTDNLISLVDLKKKKSDAVNDNTMYFLAAEWYGVKPSEVTEEQAGFISNVWAISLSIVIALIGGLLAFAGAIIGRDERLAEQPKSKKKRWMRSYIRSIMMRKRKPTIKEVQVEVPNLVEVEKVKLQIVEKEVPVEVQKVVEKVVYHPVDKLIHVPVYTDDPNLVQLGKEFTSKQGTEND